MDKVKHTFAMSAHFFDQSDEAKMSLCWTTPEANRGYSAPGREKVSQLTDIGDVEKIRAAAPDLKESLEIGREGEPGHPNMWPQEKDALSGFKTDMQEFHKLCQDVHVEVMRAIAVGMGIDEKYFDGYVDVGDNTLRLLHYPAVNADVFKINPGQVRAGEHSVGATHFLAVSHPLLTLPRTMAPSLSSSRTTEEVSK
jgi:isopenicillin N synthase-like dioxygenase